MMATLARAPDIGGQAATTSDRPVDWITRVQKLRPVIEAAAPRIEAERELPADLLDALHDAKMFRLLIPRELGGVELDLPTFVQVIEAVAEADGSVAWCLGQGSGCSMTAAYLPREAAERMFGRDRSAVLAWGAGANGKAVPVEGGFRVTGRWSYASGLRHATWLGGVSPIVGADGVPRLETDGDPTLRTFVFPKGEAEVIDDWQVLGLRGTGSDSYAVSDLFVPEAFCFVRTVPAPHPGTLYRMPLMGVYPAAFAGVALGLGRAVLGAFIAMAQGKTPRGLAPLRDNAAVQSMIGLAAARLRSARAFLLASLTEIVADLADGAPLAGPHEVTLRMCTTFAITEAAAVVDVLYHEAGASAIHQANPFERRFRDIHAVAQQIQGRRANFELVGRRLLGVDTGSLFI